MLINISPVGELSSSTPKYCLVHFEASWPALVTGFDPPGQLSSVSKQHRRRDSSFPSISTFTVSPSTNLVSFVPSINGTGHITSFLIVDQTSSSFNIIKNLSALLQIDDLGPTAITNSVNTQVVQFVRVDQTNPLAVVQDFYNMRSGRAMTCSQHVVAFII